MSGDIDFFLGGWVLMDHTFSKAKVLMRSDKL
jgi:hypothetical protein